MSKQRRESASTGGEAAAEFRGLVDAFDPGLGLSGWCAKLDPDDEPVELDLILNDLVVARTQANIARPDVCDVLGCEGQFGFCFDAAIFDRFLPIRRVMGARKFAVRVVGSSLILPMAEEIEGLSQLLDARHALLNFDGGGLALERLKALNSEAASLMTLPFRGGAASANGFIEAIAPGANGVTWFIGWMERSLAREFPAVVLDRRKFRAGFVFNSFERDDLPSDAVGVAGAILSDWRPLPSCEAIVLFSEEGGRHLRTTRALRRTGIREILEHIERAETPEAKSLARELRDLAETNDCWRVEGKTAVRVSLAVDAAAALDGFGVFMRGWIVSPSRRIKSLALKLGDGVHPCDLRTLSFTARPDLLSAFPGSPDAVDRAGFCCIFPCDPAGPWHGEAGLKIVYEDGQSSHHLLADLVINKMTPTGEGGRFREFYPNMEKEAFFAEYSLSYYESCARFYGEAVIERIEETGVALIFVAPSDRHSLYLFFEELRHNVSQCAISGVGLVILAGQELRHGEIHELFAQITEDFPGPASLLFVPDGRFALWALDSILLMIGIRKFVFVGPGILFGPSGWRALSEMLTNSAAPAVLEIGHPCEPWLPPERGMDAFAWTTEDYLSWRRNNKLPIGFSPMAAALAGATTYPDCGTIIAKNAPSPTLLKISRDMGIGV